MMTSLADHQQLCSLNNFTLEEKWNILFVSFSSFSWYSSVFSSPIFFMFSHSLLFLSLYFLYCLYFFSLFYYIQHVYAKGYICLAALYETNSTSGDDGWDRHPSLTAAVHSILLMLRCTDKAVRPKDFCSTAVIAKEDPRTIRWGYEEVSDSHSA